MTPYEPFVSTAVLLPANDVDTDQIIPARYLKGTSRDGLAEHLFAGWRYHPDGSPRGDFPLNFPSSRGAHVLVAGNNFGCGSSREHAPWALHAWGFRAVIAPSFADIFSNNAMKNGLLPAAIDPTLHADLVARLERDPRALIAVDLAAQTVTLPGGTIATFPIDPFAKRCLLGGIDELGILLALEDRITDFEKRVEFEQ